MYAALASETRLQTIDTVEVFSGSLTLVTDNRLPIDLEFDITIDGIVDADGAPLTGMLSIPAARGDGSATSGALVFDLAGSTVVPGSVSAAAAGRARASSATITSAGTTDAVTVGGDGNMVIDRLRGGLDPAATPELTVQVEELVQLTPDDIAFDDLEDAIEASTINQAPIDLTITNTADVPLEIDGFALRAVQLDATGEPNRTPGGALAYERDPSGNVVEATVADPGSSTLGVPRGAATALVVDAAAVVDRIVSLLLTDVSVGLVAVGAVRAGDGMDASMVRADRVTVVFDLAVGLDFTIPVDGVAFDRNQTTDGLDLDSSQTDDLVDRLVRANVNAVVRNTTPFGVEIEVALVTDSLGDGDDAFAQPGAVLLEMVTVQSPAVDAASSSVGAVTDTVALTIEGADIDVVLGRSYTTGIRMRLVPRDGGGTRGAIRPSDGVAVTASLDVEFRRGST